ncbi:hypothetical protein PC129_g6531 [Phytophthora cactorum]|uniref:Uncharacterized protein n=1 Tax=Phytophthora cactorum TaxID=29920 RepID=A0A8T1GVJ0_9STRA|nr:hypothetical protein PC112_g8361 [Phytophthora cactorum]KAG2932647.1 hypothetical protein PC114_g1752 [Phytophthora cactorum]KAG2998649.1 hypothetical protein PC118_g1203 [Phytophthora cactorum]KAG3222760.1 hypothetical protein PC129_g6531 [Phytophthora cactorum]
MYQDVLRDPKLRQLEGPTYAYALWNALFTIPVHVLGDGRAERVPTSSDLDYAEVDFRVDDMGLVGDRSSGVHRSFLARVAPVRWNSTLHKVTPGVKASCVMDSVSRNAAERDQAEMASQNRLRAPDVEVLSDFQAVNTEPPPIADVPAGDEIYYYGDGDHTTGMPEDFIVGEISLVNILLSLRGQPQHPIRLGRRMPNRGDCPVPENANGVPGGRPLDSAAVPPIGAPPQPMTSGHRAYGAVRCRYWHAA